MGYKNVCFPCKKAFNQGTDFTYIRNAKCPDCGVMMSPMNHRFRPPKKSALAKWKTIEFLIDHGFYFQHIVHPDLSTYASYPETMSAAKEFVLKFKSQALSADQIEKIMEDLY
ncbi:MAG: hypothetical protein P1U56_05850 [Saprospiraceae bacterium]|nr:hypothetical protein [Saprospiraceae bacterium]